MKTVRRHLTTCFLGGLVAALPVGGTIVLVVVAEQAFRPLIPARFYVPGFGLVAVALAIYLLGLTVTSLVGRWIWSRADRLLARLPALGAIYKTLKQVLGYGGGEGGLFERVVLVRDEATGAAEIGLVTRTDVVGEDARLIVFVPGSPNPSQGRLLQLPRSRTVATDWSVDRALKALFSLGKA